MAQKQPFRRLLREDGDGYSVTRNSQQTQFSSDYYIKLVHSRYMRFNVDQPGLRCYCFDGDPPPILQLTFHSTYDCNFEMCQEPIEYFRESRAVYFLPKDRLVEPSDGAKCVLSEAGQSFLSYLNRLVAGNHARGYCIAPSIKGGNVVVSLTTGESMLLIPLWYNLGSEKHEVLVRKSMSYTAVESLLKEVEGNDILDKLCDNVKDLLMKMRWSFVPNRTFAPCLDGLIQNHPCLMGTEATIFFIKEADMVFNRELQAIGTFAEMASSRNILMNLPYLTSDECWTEIAKRHAMLNYWYKFQLDSIIKSFDLRVAKSKAILFKQGQITDITLSKDEMKSRRRKLGGCLVSLHRDALNHPYEFALKNTKKVSEVWPINLRFIVTVFTLNYPMYLPRLSENIAISGRKMWDRFAFHTCFPRNPAPYGDRVKEETFWVAVLHGKDRKKTVK